MERPFPQPVQPHRTDARCHPLPLPPLCPPHRPSQLFREWPVVEAPLARVHAQRARPPEVAKLPLPALHAAKSTQRLLSGHPWLPLLLPPLWPPCVPPPNEEPPPDPPLWFLSLLKGPEHEQPLLPQPRLL